MKKLSLLFILMLPSLVLAKTRVAVISDLNGSYGSTTYSSRVSKAIKKIIELKVDAVLVTGDMVAGQKKGLNYKKMWESFHNKVTRPLIAANIPILTTPGNHDASAYSGFKRERNEYREQWLKYFNEHLIHYNSVELLETSNYPFQYSFRIGNSQFISLDATTLRPISEDQFENIKSTLILNPHLSNKFIFSHFPFHPFSQNREEAYIRDSGNEKYKKLRDLGVNYFLSGHHHSYYPGNVLGANVISQSCLGGGPRKLIGRNKRSLHSFTLLELENDNVTVSALKSPNFTEEIDIESLPRSIQYKRLPKIIRRDLVK